MEKGVFEEWKVKVTPNGWAVITTPKARHTSVCRDRGWFARITGPSKEYLFEKEFCKRSDGDFLLTNPGYYEYGHVCGSGQSNYSYNKYGGKRGFLKFDGKDLLVVDRDEVLASLAPAVPTAEKPA